MATDYSRVPRVVFALQGVALVVFGVLSLVSAGSGELFRSEPLTTVLSLRVSPVGATILLVTGIGSLIGAAARRLVGWWAGLQFFVHTMLFAYLTGEHAYGDEVSVLGMTTGMQFVVLGLATIAALFGMIVASPALGPDHPTHPSETVGPRS